MSVCVLNRTSLHAQPGTALHISFDQALASYQCGFAGVLHRRNKAYQKQLHLLGSKVESC